MANLIAEKLRFSFLIHFNTSRRTHKGATTKTTNGSKSREGTQKRFTRSQTEANFSKENSVLDIAMFCNLNDVKNPFTARTLSYEVLNLVK